jgi:hypothetical protein
MTEPMAFPCPWSQAGSLPRPRAFVVSGKSSYGYPKIDRHLLFML